MEHTQLIDKLTASARVHSVVGEDDWERWLQRRQAAHTFRVDRIAFDEMDGWSFDPDTGNLGHDSGKFFTIEGLSVQTDYGPVLSWSQPIIHQPEVGILGILVREFDGVMHCLVQTKMEPGNCNTLQLSPTVQATRSNYTKVHKGSGIPYLEYFTEPGRAQIVVDVLQSEQGAWFYQKQNRNMVVAVADDVPVGDDFCWISVGEIQRLLHVDNLVNMDLRTVLSCIPFGPGPEPEEGDGFVAALGRSLRADAVTAHTAQDILNWITDRRSRRDLVVRRTPLVDVSGWVRKEDRIERPDNRHFRIVAVAVEAASREVRRWTQPLLEPRRTGLVTLFVKRRRGVLHLLLHTGVEPGCRTVAEIAPTVQCDPTVYEELKSEPEFLAAARALRPDQIRFDAQLSEEGGRFYEATNRYVIAEVDEDYAEPAPTDYRWISLHQAVELLQHSHYVNVQARTLIACLHSLWGGAAVGGG
ncbi:NDP-hexose 2,3-dehydratase [Longispora fulva]|uniref:Oxidase EvaA n=1 Tax=Longispora fulva TaxID=619741 RepID=A0A8J7G757_9ACTN|nr:NDP-hexose 2,3-dehydratase family protein [Longispora fulva]MBG6134225.1 oxidase EvaA [Longispora fulva]GIG63117.1 NDP-hexose 2,3-dehydratase [Longispora fulva]